ncbi:hypothetical protein OC846_000482 [Tilletia horrida]|uniref:Uncharacterized protein n=1 Tax=Tilletia horrida TaxID=155126 RepID=A0AAN6K0W7_9BASI|nr:hypothetical protein OC845_001116 [Tilletia horrida]KAK0557494.1 hypothetical protein OC846_000482 [Tilletia horrida]KAK0567889.1 hypothetical protein OC861_002449 [Tilletia horrida]
MTVEESTQPNKLQHTPSMTHLKPEPTVQLGVVEPQMERCLDHHAHALKKRVETIKFGTEQPEQGRTNSIELGRVCYQDHDHSGATYDDSSDYYSEYDDEDDDDDWGVLDYDWDSD